MDTYTSAMAALDKVQSAKLPCPYQCRIVKPDGLSYNAEVVVSTQGYCLSALEPERLRQDLKWIEYLERRENETEQSTPTEVG